MSIIYRDDYAVGDVIAAFEQDGLLLVTDVARESETLTVLRHDRTIAKVHFTEVYECWFRDTSEDYYDE